LFEVKAGSGKDDSPAKNLRKRNAQSPVVETRQRRKKEVVQLVLVVLMICF
jgi:hypothetical protein